MTRHQEWRNTIWVGGEMGGGVGGVIIKVPGGQEGKKGGLLGRET